MQIDIEKIQNLLEKFIPEDSPFLNIRELFDIDKEPTTEEINNIIFYGGLLLDAELIEGFIFGSHILEEPGKPRFTLSPSSQSVEKFLSIGIELSNSFPHSLLPPNRNRPIRLTQKGHEFLSWPFVVILLWYQ
jgi:hypothetical protein